MKPIRAGMALGGALAASATSAACCLGPLVLVLLGIGGGGFALALKPYRPYFLLLTFLFLALAFYLVYRPSAPACGPDGACRIPRARRTGRVLLWIVTVLAVLLAAFPNYSEFLFH